MHYSLQADQGKETKMAHPAPTSSSRFLLNAQAYAFRAGRLDAQRGRVDGWANHSPSYRAGQTMARVELELAA